MSSEEGHHRRGRHSRQQRRRLGTINLRAKDSPRRCVTCLSGGNTAPFLWERPCKYSKRNGLYHFHCVKGWIISSGDKPCGVCGSIYRERRIVRYTTQLSFVQKLWRILFTILEGYQAERSSSTYLMDMVLCALILSIFFPAISEILGHPIGIVLAFCIGYIFGCTYLNALDNINRLEPPHDMIKFGGYFYDGEYYGDHTFDVTQRKIEIANEEFQNLQAQFGN